jgi:hypothetical protein
MNDETTLELLAIAAQLTEATVKTSAVSASHQPNKADRIEAVFADCVKAVVAQYRQLAQG